MGEHRLRKDRISRPAQEPPKGPTRLALWLIPVGVVLALFIGLLITWSATTAEDQRDTATQQRDTATQERDATAVQATTLADQVAAACATGGETAAELIRQGACQQAAQVQTEPVPGRTGDRGEPGPGPTPEQISAAVAAYMAAHPPEPGRPPTPGEVAAAVSSYLVANPPQPGRPPTPAEIAAAVETYYRANPPPAGQPGRDGNNGDDGEQGEPGRPPTPEEIRAAVEAHLAENPIPPGPACPAGSTQLPVTYEGGVVGVGCVLDDQPPPVSDPEGEGG